MEQQPQLAVTPAPEGMRMEQIPSAQVHLQAVQVVCLMAAIFVCEALAEGQFRQY